MNQNDRMHDRHADAPFGMLCTRDLMFYSQATGAAQRAGRELIVAPDVDGLYRLCRERRPDCIFLDLTLPGLDLSRAVPMIRKDFDPPPTIIGYGPHVKTELLRTARESGCDQVLTRGQFSESLQAIIERHIGLPRQSGE